ncbi:MAG: hypothetical protein R3346_02485 [Candidatus Spechtbacterales bacterium]|nr:hypothetical protein [Candidatus Spechtbacterales bacterium]
MANKQLIDYIKQELSKQTSKEKIIKDLMGSGWNDKEISEAFDSALGGDKKSSLPIKKIIIGIGIFVVLIGLAVLAYYVFYDGASDGSVSDRDAERIEGIRVAQAALETYFDQNGEYPGASEPIVCENAEENVFPALGINISDPNPDWNFIYGASNFREGGLVDTNADDYILGVAIEEEANIPDDDTPSDDWGCECDLANANHPSGAPEGTPIYCVKK